MSEQTAERMTRRAQLAIRLRPDALLKVDALAADEGCTRSQMVRILLAEALAARGPVRTGWRLNTTPAPVEVLRERKAMREPEVLPWAPPLSDAPDLW